MKATWKNRRRGEKQRNCCHWWRWWWWWRRQRWRCCWRVIRAQQLSIKLELTRARIPFTLKHLSTPPHTFGIYHNKLYYEASTSTHTHAILAFECHMTVPSGFPLFTLCWISHPFGRDLSAIACPSVKHSQLKCHFCNTTQSRHTIKCKLGQNWDHS